jgi:hypothetical protein
MADYVSRIVFERAQEDADRLHAEAMKRKIHRPKGGD